MCLITKDSEIRIAKRGIIVKRFICPVLNSDPPQFLPLYRDGYGPFEFGKVLKARDIDDDGKLYEIPGLILVNTDNAFVVFTGFHSYQLHERLEGRKEEEAKLCLAVIPRGSEYVKGIYGDIVSSRIIVFSSFSQFLKWIMKKF